MGFVQRRLVRGVLWVVSHPKITLAICAVMLVTSVGYAWIGLSLSTDENALLTPDLPFFKDYLHFDAKFPENEAFVVVAWPKDYSHPPLAKRWIGLADGISTNLIALKQDVDRVDTHAPLDALGQQALLFDDWRRHQGRKRTNPRNAPHSSKSSAKNPAESSIPKPPSSAAT